MRYLKKKISEKYGIKPEFQRLFKANHADDGPLRPPENGTLEGQEVSDNEEIIAYSGCKRLSPILDNEEIIAYSGCKITLRVMESIEFDLNRYRMLNDPDKKSARSPSFCWSPYGEGVLRVRVDGFAAHLSSQEVEKGGLELFFDFTESDEKIEFKENGGGHPIYGLSLRGVLGKELFQPHGEKPGIIIHSTVVDSSSKDREVIHVSEKKAEIVLEVHDVLLILNLES